MHEDVLIKLLREKDPTAFEYLIEHYKPIIEKFVFQYGVDPKRISDVVKEIFVKIAHKVDRFEQGSLSIFIYQMMIHTLKDDDRRQKKVQKVSGINNDSSQYGYYFEKQDHISNQINLREMNSKYKVPLILHYFYEKKSDELSTIFKTNEEDLSNRIQQGEKILEKHQKAVHPHIEKNLHDTLSEMIYAYERLPEFTDKQVIMIRIDQAKKSQKWKKHLPTFGAAIGLFLFATFGLNYIQEQKKMELKAAQEEEEAAKREAAEAVATTNPEEYVRELDPEIEEYMEKAIDNFAEEIGIEDVSNFPAVQNVRSLINELKQSPDMFGGVDGTKDYIDWMLTLPSKLLEKLESPSIASPDSFMEVLGVSMMYESEFQTYLDQLIASIAVEDYDQIVELQDSPEDYTGPEEIKRLLQILNEQGYLINKEADYGYIAVKLDYEELKSKLMKEGYGEAYLSYIDYTIDRYSENWHEWDEMDNSLLEVESLIHQHGDDYSDEFLEYIIHDMVNYLNQYLRTWDGQETVYEAEKKEYYQFLEKHPDSIYWGIINETLLDWEENDWKRKQDFITFEKIRFLFDEKYKNVKYEDIVERNRWPITTNTGANYKDFSSGLDTNLLVELNPLETVSLFAYAYDKEDADTYSLLVTLENTNEELSDEWFKKIRNSGGFGLTEYTSENTASVYFSDWEGNLITTVELMKESGIWKLLQ